MDWALDYPMYVCMYVYMFVKAVKVSDSYRINIYIYIIYTPNLGLEIAVPGREREQGRFRGSIEGARGSREGARGSREGARGSKGEHRGALWGSAEAQQVGA